MGGGDAEEGRARRRICFDDLDKEKPEHYQTDLKCGRGRWFKKCSLSYFPCKSFIAHFYLCMRCLVVSNNHYLCTVTRLFHRRNRILFYSNRKQCFQGWSCRSTPAQCGPAWEDSHIITLQWEIEGVCFYIFLKKYFTLW